MKQSSIAVDAKFAGIDYIRASVKHQDVEAAGGIDLMWAQMLSISRSRGEDHERIAQVRLGPFVGLGWRGYAFTSNQEGDVLVQAPGGASEAVIGVWGEVLRPSRIDLQLTGEPFDSVEGLIKAEYEALRRFYVRWPHRGRAPQPKLIEERARTAYSGRRSRNGVLLRVYNEGHVHAGEEPGLSSTVRYELEYTGKNAGHIYALLRKCDYDVARVARIVAGEARHRGCEAVWFGIDRVEKAARPEREKDGTEKTIRWLERQVVPALKRLSGRLQDPSTLPVRLNTGTDVAYAGI